MCILWPTSPYFFHPPASGSHYSISCFYEFNFFKVIEYLSFSVWLTSLTIMPSITGNIYTLDSSITIRLTIRIFKIFSFFLSYFFAKELAAPFVHIFLLFYVCFPQTPGSPLYTSSPDWNIYVQMGLFCSCVSPFSPVGLHFERDRDMISAFVYVDRVS